MNRWMVFLAGIVVGVMITGFYSLLKVSSDDSVNEATEVVNDKNEVVDESAEIVKEEPNGVNMFDEPGEIFNEKSFRVFQVIAKNAALAMGKDRFGNYFGITCVLANRNGDLYYDDEIVKVPNGKVARQVGIYQYPNKDGMIKTVPIIEIMDK